MTDEEASAGSTKWMKPESAFGQPNSWSCWHVLELSINSRLSQQFTHWHLLILRQKSSEQGKQANAGAWN